MASSKLPGALRPLWPDRSMQERQTQNEYYIQQQESLQNFTVV